MQDLKTFLRDSLKDAKRLAIIGIGSELRADDAAGLMAAEQLQKKLKSAGTASKPTSKKVKIFLGATAPENLTGEIKRFKPTHVIIIDTAEMDQEPGTILVLRPYDIGGGVTFSTHMMPARILADYLAKSMKCQITVIGIQPAVLGFGKPISKAVKESVKDIVASILTYGIFYKSGKKRRSL